MTLWFRHPHDSRVDLPNRLLPVAVALVAVLVSAPRRGPALAGGVIGALALASLQVAGGPAWREAGLSPTYLSITAALLGCGVILAAAPGLRPAPPDRADPWPRARVGAALMVLGLGGYAVTQVAGAGGVLRSAGALASLLVIGTALRMLMRYAGLIRWVDRWRGRRAERLTTPQPLRLDPLDRGLLAGHLLFTLLALVGAHLLLLLAGVAGAGVTGAWLGRRQGLTGRPWGLGLSLMALLPVSGATLQIAGETSGTLTALRDGPFSPAFEPLAALGFLVAAWPLLRLWPFAREELGPLTPLAGAALILRIAVPVMSSGSEHWQPLVFPLLVLVSGHATFAGDWAQAVRALALGGLMGLRPEAGWMGGLFLAGEGLLALGVLVLPRWAHGLVGAVAAVMAMVTLVPLLTGALQAQTFYTVALASSLALALAGSTPTLERRPAR